ncbi:DUF2059 domain-containing protein [Sphingomonas sp. LM7]|uniref:DUF2059 domain-containing protein n=1 Tax=Sphingomonas sp. LM7 TaxID=1938607 RepID=UPI000983EC74|nr:DUF2059 domain-containing protein [Sphingomonas sp. LM7]AQR74548.1 hypothetical protein BXU08_13640 [Sphingomonas sp. LM7]
MKRLLAALALVTASPALAHADAIGQASVAASGAEALIAELMGDDAMITLGGKAFDNGLEQELAADPKLKRAYDANPGLKDHVAAGVRGAFLKILVRELPALRRELGAIVTTDMTSTEIADTLTFFRSPVGQKLKTQVYASMADKPSQNQEQMQQAAMAAVMSSLTAEDYPALLAFGASGAAQKMQSMNPKIAAASQAWSARLIDDHGTSLRALAVKMTADFLAGKK